MNLVIAAICIAVAAALAALFWLVDATPPHAPLNSYVDQVRDKGEAADSAQANKESVAIQRQAVGHLDDNSKGRFHLSELFARPKAQPASIRSSWDSPKSLRIQRDPFSGLGLRIVYEALDDPGQAADALLSAKEESRPSSSPRSNATKPKSIDSSSMRSKPSFIAPLTSS